MPRFDLLFSYWIFTWFVLYYFKFIKYSPKFAFILGLIENVAILFIMIYHKVTIASLVEFTFIFSIFKLLPLYILRKDAIRVTDVIFTLLLFNLYLVWLLINGEDFYHSTKHVIHSLVYHKDDTPIMFIIKTLEKYLNIHQ